MLKNNVNVTRLTIQLTELMLLITKHSQCSFRCQKTPSELRAIADIIEPLIAKGQSLNHICATHLDELGISGENSL